jgi:hypothetical protein
MRALSRVWSKHQQIVGSCSVCGQHIRQGDSSSLVLQEEQQVLALEDHQLEHQHHPLIKQEG